MAHHGTIRLAWPLVLGLTAGLVACAPSQDRPTTTNGPACPTTPVKVIVSVDQWADIVSALGGQCAEVTTVITGSTDPHDFEPSPASAASFNDAQLVVVNGAGYDEWATKLAATSAPSAAVVDAAQVTNTPEGGDPHLWYGPSDVTAVADAVTAKLKELAPLAAGYFEQQRAAFSEALKPYWSEIDTIKSEAEGKPYAATEGVFDRMAGALGLVDRTPQGYQRAAGNESDPSPSDLEAFRNLLATREVDVLIYNTQTHGSIPELLRSAAEAAGVPVVEVTETPAPGSDSFQSWQVAQLTALAEALGVAA